MIDITCVDNRKNWFILWYLRLIRLLEYNIQCNNYDNCIQIISLLLPVALREFNTFINETEFIIKVLLNILNRMHQTMNVTNGQLYAIDNILDVFHENKQKGIKLSPLIGHERFIRMNEILDTQCIIWNIKQNTFMNSKSSSKITRIFKDKNNVNNVDIQFLNVLGRLLYHKMPPSLMKLKLEAELELAAKMKKKPQKQFMESFHKQKSMVSTRSRRRATLSRKRNRQYDMTMELNVFPNKKRKIMDYDCDYAADTEHEECMEMDNDNDIDMHSKEDKIEAEEEQKDDQKINDEIIIDVGEWKDIMKGLERCFMLNSTNDCYLYFMYKMLSDYKPKKLENKMLMGVYECMKRFIKLQPEHPNGYRYIITFLFSYMDFRAIGMEELLREMFDYFERIIYIDPMSKCINAGFKEMSTNDRYWDFIEKNEYFKIRFMYVKLLSVLNLIEIGHNCLDISNWKKLKNICKKICVFGVGISGSNDDKIRDVYGSILGLIENKNKYWKFMYFNGVIFKQKYNNMNMKLLSFKLQCCYMLYGNKHAFVNGFVSGYKNMFDVIPNELEMVLEIIEQNNMECIMDICNGVQIEMKVNKNLDGYVLQYGKLCVFEPIIGFTPYYLKYSMYCNRMECGNLFWEGNNNKGMNCDCSTPWNVKHKYELSNFKYNVLQQFNYEMKELCYVFYERFMDGIHLNGESKSKKKLIDCCWMLMKKLKRMKEIVADVPLVENVDFIEQNENVCKLFDI